MEDHQIDPDPSTEIEGRRFHHPTCKVCNSPQRDQIEIAISLGVSGPTIVTRFPESNLNRQNIGPHRQGHMAVVSRVVAEAVRLHSRAAARAADAAAGAVVGRLEIIESLLEAGLQSARAGQVRFSTADILGLAAERERLIGEHMTMERMLAEGAAFGDAVRARVPHEHWEPVYQQYLESMAVIEASGVA